MTGRAYDMPSSDYIRLGNQALSHLHTQVCCNCLEQLQPAGLSSCRLSFTKKVEADHTMCFITHVFMYMTRLTALAQPSCD